MVFDIPIHLLNAIVHFNKNNTQNNKPYIFVTFG